MADRLANEAADECVRGRAFDQDVSKSFTKPFQHMLRLQQKKQVQTEGGTPVTTERVNGLDDCHGQRERERRILHPITCIS